MFGFLTELYLMAINKYRIEHFQVRIMVVRNSQQLGLLKTESHTVLLAVVGDKVQDVGEVGQFVCT